MSDTLKEGHFVHLFVEADDRGYYQVTEREPFTYKTGSSSIATEFTAVAAGAQSNYQSITPLEPSQAPEHIYQVRWGVRDGFHYYIKVPTGTDRLGLDKDKGVGYITNWKSPYYDPDEEYEFWLFWGYYPSINAKSEGANNQVAGTPEVWFKGWKYAVSKIADAPLVTRLKNFEQGLPNSTPVRKIVVGGLIGGR